MSVIDNQTILRDAITALSSLYHGFSKEYRKNIKKIPKYQEKAK